MSVIPEGKKCHASPDLLERITGSQEIEGRQEGGRTSVTYLLWEGMVRLVLGERNEIYYVGKSKNDGVEAGAGEMFVFFNHVRMRMHLTKESGLLTERQKNGAYRLREPVVGKISVMARIEYGDEPTVTCRLHLDFVPLADGNAPCGCDLLVGNNQFSREATSAYTWGRDSKSHWVALANSNPGRQGCFSGSVRLRKGEKGYKNGVPF